MKAYCLLIGFFCTASPLALGQDQRLADSLIEVYHAGTYQEDERDILAQIAAEETNPDRSLEYSELLIDRAAADSSNTYLYKGYLQKGNALKYRGDNARALEAYFKSLYYANRTNDEKGIGSLLISIAGMYTVMGNTKNAHDYFNKGITVLREVGDSVKIATALLNAGDDYFNAGKLDSAVIYTRESAAIFAKIDHPLGQAYSLGNLGMIYAQQEKDILGERYINDAVAKLEKLEDYYPIAVYLTFMSDIYIRKNDLPRALDYSQRSLNLAMQYRLKEQISEANLKLSEIYEKSGDPEASFRHYKDYITYRDSLINVEKVQEIADIRTDFEVSQKQLEVDLLNQQKRTQRIIAWVTTIGLLLIGILAIGLYRRNKFIQRTKRIIEQEKNRSESLLLNILPAEIAEELKANGRAEARYFERVSILFTDFKGFTEASAQLSAQELVTEINTCFEVFDRIMVKYGIEKIKTIGDAYMAAGGLPVPEAAAVKNTVLAALEMQEFIRSRNAQMQEQGNHSFEMRAGIHTGPVVAGIVGTLKFQYDIWGDAVNTASRLESNGQVGKVNISEQTYELLKDDGAFTFVSRGRLQAKGKGEIEMYFVEKTANPSTKNTEGGPYGGRDRAQQTFIS